MFSQIQSVVSEEMFFEAIVDDARRTKDIQRSQ